MMNARLARNVFVLLASGQTRGVLRPLVMVAFAWIITLTAAASASPPVQWPVAAGGNGHWYQAVLTLPPHRLDWDDANAAAEATGGYLATITSAAENAFVYGLVDDDANLWWGSGSYKYGPWLGGIQPSGSSDPADNWQWVTGEDFSSYTNWYSGQPNDGDAHGQDGLHFLGSGGPSDRWNDAWRGQPMYGYIIESPVPEPATLSLLGLGMLALIRRRKG